MAVGTGPSNQSKGDRTGPRRLIKTLAKVKELKAKNEDKPDEKK